MTETNNDLSRMLNDILYILFEAQKANSEQVSKTLVAGVIEIIFTWSKEMEIKVDDLRVTDAGTGWDRFGVAREQDLLCGQTPGEVACALVLFDRGLKGDTQTLASVRETAVTLYKEAMPAPGDKLPFVMEVMFRAIFQVVMEMHQEYFENGKLKPEYAVWGPELIQKNNDG